MAAFADLIKELRTRTGAGITDCKKALEETSNDIEASIKFLREKGLAQAAKKAGRIAAEGLCDVLVSDDGKTGVVLEINIETDFAAKADRFTAFAKKVGAQVLSSSANTVEEFLAEAWADDASLTVESAVKETIAATGENINIRRFERINKTTPGKLFTYIHGGGKIAVLVDLEADALNDAVLEAGKNICLQTAALLPKFISLDDIPEDFKAAELEIIKTLATNENNESPNPKPEKVLENIINGRFSKYAKGICLLEQEYVKDGSLTVSKYIEQAAKDAGASIKINRFVCFELGEGIEKKQENFADEVAKAASGS